MKLGKILYAAVIVMLVSIFGISAFHVGAYLLESRREQEHFDALAAIKNQAIRQTASGEADPVSDTDFTVSSGETIPTQRQILYPYTALYAQNSHMVGWIKIEGTKIDYPVMQTPDEPNYYLKRNFSGNYSEHGCIYVREECDVEKPSDNITIYGHNMRDGSMFAALLDYENKTAWDRNPLIFFDTLTEYHVYKIFAVFKTTANISEGFKYHNLIDANGEEDFNRFIETARNLSFYDTGIIPVYGEKIICLSTCEYTLEDGRFVVAAVRIS